MSETPQRIIVHKNGLMIEMDNPGDELMPFVMSGQIPPRNPIMITQKPGAEIVCKLAEMIAAMVREKGLEKAKSVLKLAIETEGKLPFYWEVALNISSKYMSTEKDQRHMSELERYLKSLWV